jgi:hypothetical protein
VRDACCASHLKGRIEEGTMNHVMLRCCGDAMRIAAIALVLSCGAAVAQTNAPGTNAPPAAPGGRAPVPAAPTSPPAAAAASGVRACPPSAQEVQQPTDCVCTAAAMEADAPVWGADIYTDDSSICRAARHAGVIAPGGGSVRVTPRGPQSSYEAAERNGVASAAYGPYERSFSVAASDARSDVDVNQCPDTFQGYRARSDVITCTCTAEQMADGPVWGTDVYTDDSTICRAAVHAGAVAATGGPVRLQTAPARQSYAGSTRNGVWTQDYGPWEGAFSFVK